MTDGIEELAVVRTLVDAQSDDQRIVPAGTVATVAHVGEGYYLLDVAFRPQTAGDSGDFAQAVVTPDQITLVSRNE